MKLNFDFSPWISPVSGNIAFWQSFPDLPVNYTIEGDRENRPQPSSALIDIRLDIIGLRHAIDNLEQRPYPDLDATYILQQPDANLPNAQALNQLSNGLMKNNNGVIQIAIPNQDYLIPSLPSGQLWIGNNNNIATPQQTITLDNLPSLGTSSVTIPNPFDPTKPITISGGKIWKGTDSGRPEESTALLSVEADLALVNMRFLTGEYIMADAAIHTFWPKSQFLVNLQDGMLKKTGKVLQQAVSGTDYVDAIGNPVADAIPVWSQNNSKLLTNTNITVVNGEDVRGVNSLMAVLLQAQNAVTSDQDVIARTTLQSRQLILYDYDDAHRYTFYTSLKGPASITQNLVWVMPSAISTTGQVLTDIGANLVGERLLGFSNILPNNLQDGLLAQGRDADNNPIFINANLTNKMFWQGDANNKPVEVELKIAPNDATYIIKQPNADLTNAQVLSELGVGMAKIVAGGAFAIAVAGEDYATAQQLQEIEQQCQQYAEQAATSAEEAATSAGEAATSAGEAAASAAEATGAAAEATGAAAAASGSATAAGLSAAGAAASAVAAGLSAGSASSSASDASSSASDASHSASNAGQSATNAANSATQAQTYLNTLLTTGLTLQGDVNGSGLLSSPIVTTFKPNPVFSGNQSMAMPSGNSFQRPTTLIPGMIRFNTSL